MTTPLCIYFFIWEKNEKKVDVCVQSLGKKIDLFHLSPVYFHQSVICCAFDNKILILRRFRKIE